MNSIGNLYNRILKVAKKDSNGTIPTLNINDIG
jgi:methionyl-tRNA synthetase